MKRQERTNVRGMRGMRGTWICALALVAVQGCATSRGTEEADAAADVTRQQAWEAQVRALVEAQDPATAKADIEILLADLKADPSPEARFREAQLLIQALLPRQSRMQQGATAGRALGVLEELFEVSPDHVSGRYLHVRTSLALPAFFGKQAAGIASLLYLVELEERAPGSVPMADVFVLAAQHDPGSASHSLEVGRRAFPNDPRLRASEPDPESQATEDAGSTSADPKALFLLALRRGELPSAHGASSLEARLDAAETEHPNDARIPLHRGLLGLWRAEAEQNGDAAFAAIEPFRRALAKNPDDTRIYGWLGPLLYIMGRSIDNADLVEEGAALMDLGVELNPAQNRFGRALAHHSCGDHPDVVIDDLFGLLEACTEQVVDRTRFRTTGPIVDHPACMDSDAAPYNLSGTLFWAGEVFRSRSETQRARDAFEGSLRYDDAKSWPFRAHAEDRLKALEQERPAQLPPPVSCLLCHQV
tara:strand:+ start:1961 stop:3391 length:1431 start_codon:yes stop_codon:yes gene_type:complete